MTLAFLSTCSRLRISHALTFRFLLLLRVYLGDFSRYIAETGGSEFNFLFFFLSFPLRNIIFVSFNKRSSKNMSKFS